MGNDPLLVVEHEPAGIASKSKRKVLLKLLSDSSDVIDLKNIKLNIVRYDLSYHSEVALYELSSDQWVPVNGRLFYMDHDGEFYSLNGTSPPIHEVNAKADIVINEATVLDYLAFFCFFVRGDEGPFFIVDRPDNSLLPDISEIKEFDSWFRAPRIWGQDPNGDWRVSALVYYSDAIFHADFLVHLSGMIEMELDVPLLTELEKVIDAPLNLEGLLSD